MRPSRPNEVKKVVSQTDKIISEIEPLLYQKFSLDTDIYKIAITSHYPLHECEQVAQEYKRVGWTDIIYSEKSGEGKEKNSYIYWLFKY